MSSSIQRYASGSVFLNQAVQTRRDLIKRRLDPYRMEVPVGARTSERRSLEES